jgi:hypothetical protein
MHDRIVPQSLKLIVFVLFFTGFIGARSHAQAPSGPMASSSPASKKEAVQEPAAMQFIEVTRVDFTKLEKITASRLSVFGVALGDSAEGAIRKIENAGLRVKAAQSPGQFYVYEGNDQLLTLSIESGAVTQIILYDVMVRHPAGESGLLLDANSTSLDSAVRLRLLGREDNRSEERSSVGRTVSCSYDREGIRLVRVFFSGGDSLGSMRLVMPAKPR